MDSCQQVKTPLGVTMSQSKSHFIPWTPLIFAVSFTSHSYLRLIWKSLSFSRFTLIFCSQMISPFCSLYLNHHVFLADFWQTFQSELVGDGAGWGEEWLFSIIYEWFQHKICAHERLVPLSSSRAHIFRHTHSSYIKLQPHKTCLTASYREHHLLTQTAYPTIYTPQPYLLLTHSHHTHIHSPGTPPDKLLNTYSKELLSEQEVDWWIDKCQASVCTYLLCNYRVNHYICDKRRGNTIFG